MAMAIYSRADVAQHSAKQVWDEETSAMVLPANSDPWIILDNKVYDITRWLDDHPGGPEILLQHAGNDATADFEAMDHSDFARGKREEFCIGTLRPEDHRDWRKDAEEARRKVAGGSGGGSGGGRGGGGGGLAGLIPGGGATVGGLGVVALGLYIRKAMTSRAIPSKVTYSAALRHAHLGMALGVFGSVATVQAALRTEDAADRKRYMSYHKTCGALMLVAGVVRLWLRLRSAIPPRFPGSELMQLAEGVSHRLLYALLLALPVSGLCHDFYSGGGIRLLGIGRVAGKAVPDDEDQIVSQSAIDAHRLMGKALEYALVPFHLAGSLFHAAQGRDLVRRIGPFI